MEDTLWLLMFAASPSLPGYQDIDCSLFFVYSTDKQHSMICQAISKEDDNRVKLDEVDKWELHKRWS